MTANKHIYGPVSSWRLGRSLGIDPVCRINEKKCSFNCIYCQAGRTQVLTAKRKDHVKTKDIIKEISSLPPQLKIDYITFSGRGEPTLARNLGKIIKSIKKIRKDKIAVITNSSLIYKKDVQMDLALADFVMAKLDAHSESFLKKINKPKEGIKFNKIIKGLKRFNINYRGKLALQVMFSKDNKMYAGNIANIAKKIKPDEIQINTPLRPSGVRPLAKKELMDIKKVFRKKCKNRIKIISVYEKLRKKR